MKHWKPILPVLCASALIILAGVYFNIDTALENDEPRPSVVYIYKTTLGVIEFWSALTDGIEAGAREYGIDYKITGALEELDIAGNIAAVDAAIAMKPDVIILSASDYKLLEPAAKKVVENDILLLTIDSAVAGDWSRCFVATDNYEVGRKMGEEMNSRIPDDGKIAIIGHIEGASTAIERISGAVDEMGLFETDRLIGVAYCDNRLNQAALQAKAFLRECPDLAGIIGTNEISSLGIGMAIAELGLKDQVTVIACDNSSRQITYIEQGIIDATVVQKPFNMGYMSVQLAVELLNGKANIAGFHDTGSKVITKDNLFTPENQKLLFPFRE